MSVKLESVFVINEPVNSHTGLPVNRPPDDPQHCECQPPNTEEPIVSNLNPYSDDPFPKPVKATPLISLSPDEYARAIGDPSPSSSQNQPSQKGRRTPLIPPDVTYGP